jgi:hypothetical protein
LELILKNVMSIPEAVMYLPDLKELSKVPKAYICNITYSVVGDTFAEWVHHRIKERNEKVTIKRDLNISIQPSVLAAFLSSNAVSM